MKRVRLWILGAVMGSFAAGMSVGLLVSQAMAAPVEIRPVDGDYLRDMVSTYGLTAKQERQLRFVLQKGREEEIAILTSTEATQLPESVQSRLLGARRRMEQRTQALLDDRQRALYEAASRPTESR